MKYRKFSQISTQHFVVLLSGASQLNHDDVIKCKHFPRYWPFVRWIPRSPVNSPHKWPVTRSFDVFFDLCLNKRLSKQSWGWWFETPSCPLWRHRNAHTLWHYFTGLWLSCFREATLINMGKWIAWIYSTLLSSKTTLQNHVHSY